MNRYARAAGVIGFVGALATGALMTSTIDHGSSVAVASGCPKGQVQSVSKYTGKTCISNGGKVGKGIATVTVGCVLGVPGGLPGIAYGCAGGLASVVIDNAY